MQRDQTADATQEPVKWRNEDKREIAPLDEKKMTAAELEKFVKEQILAKEDINEDEKQE